jgi:hypothetical protein
MRKLATSLMSVAALAGMAGCSDPLDVQNRNNPDVDRTYSTPGQIEQLISSVYNQIHVGLHGTSNALQPSLQALSFESYGTNANFGVGTRTGIPRVPIDNSRNNSTYQENFRDYSTMAQRARDASNGIRALDALMARGGTLGNAGQDNTSLNRRARSFGLFANGVALGNIALTYDSASIVTHMSPVATEEPLPPFFRYDEVMAAALAQLDSAITEANRPGNSAFTVPKAWINNRDDITHAAYIRLIRSHKARFRAGVARTPQERIAVDWGAVIADATNGITEDHIINVQGAANTGWALSYLGSQMFADDSKGWHMMPLMIYGMADTSGGYDAFIAQPLDSRGPFLVRTPDQRWPKGDTRAEQRTNSLANNAYNSFALPYIRNRPGEDTQGAGWGTSWYDFYRFKNIHLNSITGPWVAMARAEINMLAAEGHIRQGNFAAAMALINPWRTRAGLPALTGITSLNDRAPGGNACVPRVPTGTGAVQCGNIMEAMKWEKRMETAMTGYGQWFFDARGWGDLPEGTPLQFPVPYQERDARTLSSYSLGGLGGNSAAAKGTYGF